MCGIAGVFGLDGLSHVGLMADKMMQAMDHRGPDAHGIFQNHQVLLTHSRLSILDLDPRSNQPFHDPEGRFVLIFNGEIYNYRELKSSLSAYEFKTTSDTEVVMAAWREWGPACVERFNGMFAFAIWDDATETLTIARDRLGIKPIYFYRAENRLIFASEIRTLLASSLVPRRLAKEHLGEFLKYFTVHAPRTMVEGVELLMPGHMMTVTANSLRQERYWSIQENFEPFGEKKREAAQVSIRRLLTEAVERRLLSDVPLGAFLSGGIDSSLLVAIIRRELGRSLDTFSVTFTNSELSEAPYSRLVAKEFSTHHNEIELSADTFLNDIPGGLEAVDHPSGDGLNSYVVSQAVKTAGLSVALSGLGGDELFAGYPFFRQFYFLQNKNYLLKLPLRLRARAAQPLSWFGRGSRWQKIQEAVSQPSFSIANTYPINRRVLSDMLMEEVLEGEPRDDCVVRSLEQDLAYGNARERLPLLSQVSMAEATYYMQNVLLRDTDQMSMAHALEVRVPFLDHALVEYVLGIPDELKYPRFPKSLLVDAFPGLLPESVVHRPKMGFVLPWETWMKQELRPLCKSSLELLESSAYFRAGSLTRLFETFEEGGIGWARVWPLVALGDWMQGNAIA